MHWLALPLPWRDEAEGAGGPPPAAAGWWALRFTPRVALVDGEAVLLELSTTERLWGGRAALRAQVLQAWSAAAGGGGPGAPGEDAAGGGAARPASPPPHADPAAAADAETEAPPWGAGPTALVAQAVLRTRQAGRPPPARVRDLPLATLTALRPHVPSLERMGCRTWGALRALPRAGVARRFGAGVLQVLDQALGDAPEVHPWLELPAQFALAIELPALAESADALLWSAQRALAALQGWLQARQQGALALELAWRHDLRRIDGVALPPTQALRVRTARPTQELAHLRRLLSEHLARTRLAAPANQITLRLLEAAPLPHRSASLLPPGAEEAGRGPGAGPDGEARGEPLHQLLERLSARLGAAQVQAPQLLADHRPECMQRWLPAAGVLAAAPAGRAVPSPAGRSTSSPAGRSVPTPGDAPHAPTGALLPTWLVRPPRPLAVQGHRPCHHGPLRLLAGPHRFQAGWWDSAEAGGAAPVERDYFLAHNDAAGLVWVFREWPAPAGDAPAGEDGALAGAFAAARPVRWFLHGIFG